MYYAVCMFVIYVAIVQLRARTLTSLNGKYAKIVIKVQDIIENKNFDIKKLILRLCNADGGNLTIFSSDEVFLKITDINVLFHQIGKYCSMYDFQLLLAFVVSTDFQEAIQLLNDFTEEVRHSILSDLDLLSEGGELLNPKDFMPNTHKLVIKYVGGGECTLAAKEMVQNIIYECFHLWKGLITFKGVQEGCFAFVYQISAAVKCHMLQKDITSSDVTMLAENYISCISIDDVELKISSQVNYPTLYYKTMMTNIITCDIFVTWDLTDMYALTLRLVLSNQAFVYIINYIKTACVKMSCNISFVLTTNCGRLQLASCNHTKIWYSQ